MILMYGRRWQADLPALRTKPVLKIKIVLKKAIALVEILDHSRLADIQMDTCSPEYHYHNTSLLGHCHQAGAAALAFSRAAL